MENMEIWNKVKTPPKAALKKITGGRLSGMTDINPQWRYGIMTDIFGPCGIGWRFEIVKLWWEDVSEGQRLAFAQINLFITYNYDGQKIWSEPIPGIGGSMMIANERNGPHSSDECYKMAVTDALSVAMKLIGVASDIYMGRSDSKYQPSADEPPPKEETPESEEPQGVYFIDNIEEKSGVNKETGKPWKLWILISGDLRFGTFDEKYADIANDCATQGIKCFIKYEEGRRGKTVTYLEADIGGE